MPTYSASVFCISFMLMLLLAPIDGGQISSLACGKKVHQTAAQPAIVVAAESTEKKPDATEDEGLKGESCKQILRSKENKYKRKKCEENKEKASCVELATRISELKEECGT